MRLVVILRFAPPRCPVSLFGWQRNAFLSLHCCYAWRRRFGSRFAGGDGRRDTDLTLTRFSIAIIIVPALSLRGGTASTGNPPHGSRRGHYACPGAQRAQDIIGCACGLGCHLRPEQLQATQVDQEDLPGIYTSYCRAQPD